ncbi:MAG: flagellar biosynthesis protein FlhA [Chloroherpetonaceae bacterium]|nr:flagellar biosynthesis protein FlhA [Chthonomonadaceae bacterium]MDW8206607.1 flagellar biosynthesis protein FlhA [Chloroherpetonaceae bacterium]
MAVVPGNPQSILPNPLLRLLRQTDVLLAALLMLIVAMLIVPLPEWLLDTMLVVNIAASATILLVALYNTEPLEFSVFPALLLVATLFRLALNIAATKLILGTGHAGAIIAAFGQFVVGGSYIVGIIAFLILVVVQFVVITNGAGRVAEVAARFTLDAMPGKQMSIDADLNAGLITEAEARERRRKIEREADFYGAMDGASKFVRGDAIAAVLITIINIVGGFALGASRGGELIDTLQRYTLLTIGEGLVSQIPALLISTATGLIVTRAASERSMGQDFVAQLFSRPRPLMIVAALLLVLLVLPGFPKPQLLILSACAGAGAWFLTQRERTETALRREAEEREKRKASEQPKGPEAVIPLLGVETIEVELGSNLVPLALPEEGGDLAERVGGVRKQIAMEMGIILPTVRIRDNLQLRANAYQIKLKGAVMAVYELMPHCVLALDSGLVTQSVEGIPTVEPAHGTPALWIAHTLKERAELAGYITVDPATVLITHLTEIIKAHAAELLTRQETQRLVDHVKRTDEAVVNELIPNLLTLGEVQSVLQRLLRERVSIRDLTTIMETLADYAPRTKDLDQLAEFARAALARQICRQYQEEDGKLYAITLAPPLEQTLRDAVQATPSGNMLAIDPGLAQAILSSLNQQIARVTDQGYSAVLLCSSQIRLPLRRLTERTLPTLPILAYTEIVPGMEVEAVGMVEAELQLAA